MAIQNQQAPQQRVWGQGMGQSGFPQMPFVPPYQMQHPFGMPPNQFASQGGANPQRPQLINHPFLNEHGLFDFNKVIGHANNINKLIGTAQPMIKQLSPLFNMFRGV